jgi:hypothetical protein
VAFSGFNGDYLGGGFGGDIADPGGEIDADLLASYADDEVPGGGPRRFRRAGDRDDGGAAAHFVPVRRGSPAARASCVQTAAARRIESANTGSSARRIERTARRVFTSSVVAPSIKVRASGVFFGSAVSTDEKFWQRGHFLGTPSERGIQECPQLVQL